MARRPNPRNANGHRARQLRARVLAEGGPCGLCGRPVDTSLPAGLPASPEVDHIIPVSRGGAVYDRANAVIIHRACNNWKSNLTLNEARAKLAGNAPRKAQLTPIVHSGTW